MAQDQKYRRLHLQCHLILPGSAPISGQLLTLPSSVLSKVNAQQPLQLRVNNQKLVIPPNCFIPTPDGVKVFLPAGTLPPTVVNSENKAANVQLSVNKDQGEQSVSVLCGPNGKRQRIRWCKYCSRMSFA